MENSPTLSENSPIFPENDDSPYLRYNVKSLIIGGGPAGLTLGICLLKQGKSVVISEKHIEGHQFSRVILLTDSTLNIIGESISTELSDKLHASGIPIDGLSFYALGRRISQTMIDGNAARSVCLQQSETERVLREEFINHGGRLLIGYKFDSSTIQKLPGDRFSTLLTHVNDDTTAEINFEYLFGCDGTKSQVREYLGIKFTGFTQAEKGHFIDAELETWPFDTNINFWLKPEGAMGAIRIGPNSIRVIGTTTELCEDMLNALAVTKISWRVDFPISYRLAEYWGCSNFWLAGDAAHEFSPVGGRGLNMSIADAIFLARAIGDSEGCDDSDVCDEDEETKEADEGAEVRSQSVAKPRKAGQLSRAAVLASYQSGRKRIARNWVFINYIFTQLIVKRSIFFYCLRYMLSLMFIMFSAISHTFPAALFGQLADVSEFARLKRRA